MKRRAFACITHEQRLFQGNGVLEGLRDQGDRNLLRAVFRLIATLAPHSTALTQALLLCEAQGYEATQGNHWERSDRQISATCLSCRDLPLSLTYSVTLPLFPHSLSLSNSIPIPLPPCAPPKAGVTHTELKARCVTHCAYARKAEGITRPFLQTRFPRRTKACCTVIAFLTHLKTVALLTSHG